MKLRRPVLVSLAFVFAAALPAAVRGAELPRFVGEPMHSPNSARVSKVVSSLSADLVILDGGREQGLRLGMVCTVSRGLRTIGELVIIEARSDRSAALILDLAEHRSIQSGDVARIKTFQTS